MNRISIVRVVLSLVTLCALFAAGTFARPATMDGGTSVGLTGLITCSRCLGQAQHKGFTRWTWATYNVSQGDDIVIIASGKVYRLTGERQELSKYLEDKASITGKLVDTSDVVSVTDDLSILRSGMMADTVEVVSIGRYKKGKK